MAENLSDRIEALFDNAFMKAPDSDQYTYAVAVTGIPVGPGQFAPALFITVWLDSAVLERSLNIGTMIQNPQVLTQEDANTLVLQVTEALAAERSKELTDPVAHVNSPDPGSKSPGGILLP